MEYNITYRQKDKGWQYIISYKVNGKWKQKSKQGFSTKKEAKPFAEKALKELKTSRENEKNIINENYDSITFKELTSQYIEHSKLYKEYNTIRSYSNYAKAFESLNDIKVININKVSIQKVVDSLVTTKLSSSTIKEYLKRSTLFFKYYIENYNPNYTNPINNITLPKIEKKINKKALTKKELDLLLKNLKNIDSDYYIISLLAGSCGLRAGEILGLTWNDIDEINSTLNINKQWKRLDKKVYGFGSLKSNNSVRVVPIPKNTLKELKEYHLISITDIHNRILPFNETKIYNLNHKLRKISNISIHELRHTYATLLISNGVDFKTAAEILGHEVNQLIKTYSHVTNDMMNKATNTIAKIF
ncbi:tyrosine-type recombinase/integrase [Clostridium nigeriense]|uniref:tyrosine-type recombinase/integrase n=1 Tax=Clostridium nigeriense TaxID=1805470 RepID=UPI003D33C4F7